METESVPVDGPTYLGTTPPVSYSVPLPDDLNMNNELIAYMERSNVFETRDGQIARDGAITILLEFVSSLTHC